MTTELVTPANAYHRQMALDMALRSFPPGSSPSSEDILDRARAFATFVIGEAAEEETAA